MSSGPGYRGVARSRKALPTTLTDDSAMAAAAMIGDSRMPKLGIEDAGGDRDAGGVVDEGEEQVLPDVAHGRLRKPARANDAAEVALQQRDAGALHRDVGAGPHGDADLGGGERRGVVDAVAGHGDDPPGLLQPGDHGALLIRKHLRLDIGDPEFPRHGIRRGPVVSGQHDDLDAFGRQRLQAHPASTA